MSTTGAGDPWTHTITAATTRPWVTLWPEWNMAREKLTDAKLDKLVISGKTRDTLRVVASWQSIGAAYKTAAETGATPLETSNRFLHYDGAGALKIEGAAEATVDDWTLTIDNHGVVIGGDSLTPNDILDGELTVDLVINRITPSAALRNRLYYGGASPTDATAVVQAILELAGAPAGIDFLFTRVAASRSLELKVPRVAVQSFDPSLSVNPSDYLKDAIPLTALLPTGGVSPITAVALSGRATVF